MWHIILGQAKLELTHHSVFSIEERTDEYIMCCMPVTEKVHNPFGVVHAGVMLGFAHVTATILPTEGEAVQHGRP